MSDPRLFSKWLEAKGVHESRCRELYTGFYHLLRALCALDNENLSCLAKLGGIQAMMEKFEEIEDFYKAGSILHELTTVENTPIENLPLLIGALKFKEAQKLLEKRLRTKETLQ